MYAILICAPLPLKMNAILLVLFGLYSNESGSHIYRDEMLKLIVSSEGRPNETIAALFCEVNFYLQKMWWFVKVLFYFRAKRSRTISSKSGSWGTHKQQPCLSGFSWSQRLSQICLRPILRHSTKLWLELHIVITHGLNLNCKYLQFIGCSGGARNFGSRAQILETPVYFTLGAARFWNLASTSYPSSSWVCSQRTIQSFWPKPRSSCWFQRNGLWNIRCM